MAAVDGDPISVVLGHRVGLRVLRMQIASSKRNVPRTSVLAVYSGVSKPIRTWLCAARL